MSVVSTREFWEAKVKRICTLYEYGAISWEETIEKLNDLGYNEMDLEELVEEYILTVRVGIILALEHMLGQELKRTM